jgi:hypothetical protein
MIIIYEQKNEPVAIINLAEGFTIEEAILQIPPGTKYRVINELDLPPEEDLLEFADSLTINFDKNLEVNAHFNIEQAREITKTRLRKERIEYFEQNDILLRDAIIENNSENLNIAIIERNRLRDITITVDTVNTIDQLRSISIKK